MVWYSTTDAWPISLSNISPPCWCLWVSWIDCIIASNWQSPVGTLPPSPPVLPHQSVISSWRWPPLTLQSCLSQFTPSHKVQPAWQAGLMMFSLQRPQTSTALMVSECFQPCLVVDRQPRHSSCWPPQRLNYTSISISKPADLTTQTELFSGPASC